MKADEVRYEMKQQRQELGQTAQELREIAGQRIASAKQAVNPLEYARAYPLIAVGVALGAGLAIAMSGADKKAASGAVEGAKAAGSAIGDGASSVKEKVVNLVHRDGGSDATSAAASSEPEKPGMRARLRSDIDQLLADGLKDLLGALGADKKSGRA